MRGQESALRAALVERMRQLVDGRYAEAERQLEADGDGSALRRAALGLPGRADQARSTIFTTHHVYRADNPSDAERMAVVAVKAAMAAALLAPGSDIDLLFLLPYKQTAWGESVAEYMLYLLWDLGFKVGHATRTIDRMRAAGHSDMTIRTALLEARFILGDAALFADLQRRFRKEVRARARRPSSSRPSSPSATSAIARAGAIALSGRAQRQGRQGRLARPAHAVLDRQVSLSRHEPTAEFVEAACSRAHEYRELPPLRGFPVGGALPSAFPHRPGRGAADLRRAAARWPSASAITAHGGLRGVERFMKHYFLVAKEVGDLTRIVCAALEMKQLKRLPRARHAACAASPRRGAQAAAHLRLPHRERPHQRRRQGRVRKRDPVNFIRLFAARRRAPCLVLSRRRCSSVAPLAAADRRHAAQRTRGEPAVPRAC